MAKYYDSFLCMVVEEPTKVQDSIPVEGKKYTIHGHTFEVLKIKGENVSTKWDDGVTRILPFSYFEKAKAKDANVRDGKNEYEIHYTIPGKNGTMVGSGRGPNEQEAKADFMAYHKSENPTITNIKLYKALDKAIRSCDVNKAKGFKIYNAYVRNDTLYIEYEDLLYGNGKKEKESFTRSEAKRLLTDPWSTWLGTSKTIVKQFAG